MKSRRIAGVSLLELVLSYTPDTCVRIRIRIAREPSQANAIQGLAGS
jgi:hypothetical protein